MKYTHFNMSRRQSRELVRSAARPRYDEQRTMNKARLHNLHLTSTRRGYIIYIQLRRVYNFVQQYEYNVILKYALEVHVQDNHRFILRPSLFCEINQLRTKPQPEPTQPSRTQPTQLKEIFNIQLSQGPRSRLFIQQY